MEKVPSMENFCSLLEKCGVFPFLTSHIIVKPHNMEKIVLWWTFSFFHTMSITCINLKCLGMMLSFDYANFGNLFRLCKLVMRWSWNVTGMGSNKIVVICLMLGQLIMDFAAPLIHWKCRNNCNIFYVKILSFFIHSR